MRKYTLKDMHELREPFFRWLCNQTGAADAGHSARGFIERCGNYTGLTGFRLDVVNEFLTFINNEKIS